MVTLSNVHSNSFGVRLSTFMMLEMEYSSLLGQYHACWCSRQGIGMHDIDSRSGHEGEAVLLPGFAISR